MLHAKGKIPRLLTRPIVGRIPVRLFTEHGSRTEPPVSVPSAAGTSFAATAAPEPPEEPEAIRSKSQGFFTTPKCGFSEVAPQANSCMFVFATKLAPADLNLLITSESSSGILSASILLAPEVTRPATDILSLTAIGTPCKGPKR